jgi:hypothetical protein
MAEYYVHKNAQGNGDHEVHTTGCAFMPNEANRIYLGDFATCARAVVEAQKHYQQSNGCYFCARPCNTG